MVDDDLNNINTTAENRKNKPGGICGSGNPYVTSIPNLAVHTITWANFNSGVNLQDNDRILFREEDRDENTCEVEVILKSSVSWWKEIKAFSYQGNELGWIGTQDASRGPVSMLLETRSDASPYSAQMLVFSKAKAFGVHTGMYQVLDLYRKSGKRLIFEWQRD